MIKKILKFGGLGILLILIALGGFGAHEWYAKKPLSFNNFVNREVVKIAFESPETLTSLGFLESFGFRGHNAKLDDASPENADRLFENLENFKASLQRYEDEDLDQSELLSKEIAMYLLDFAEQAKEYRHHTYPANQLFGFQNGFPSFMEAQHQVNSLEDAENYISRLQKLPTKFAQNTEGLIIRENKGIIPPRFVVQRVIDEISGFVNTPTIENILYVSLRDKLENAKDITDEQRDDVLSRAKSEIENSVYPAYQKLLEYLQGLALKAGDDDGFWHLPNGDKAYKLALKFFTTTDYSADYIHQLGLQEVARIQSEILQILAAEQYDVSAGFTSAMAALASNEEFYYEDSDAGREQILRDYQTIIDEIDEGINEVFNIRPEAGMEVVRIPEFKEKTAPGAYYQQPSIGGSRPGRFFANLYDIKATPKYSMRTLAYHEGIPGHHFQIATAMELKGLPLFRKMSPFTAYTEGWALYTEQLAYEMGFQNDPFDNIGRLQAELFRAVRLVVDTGIHAKRWTREQAITYMIDNTGMAESDVIAEIERYIVMPGQATSYKVGMIKILELRQKAKDALGDKFDLRDFHDVVLKNGAVPLDILESLVEQYIQDTLNA